MYSAQGCARVAQLDRASASGAEGCGFDPRLAYQLSETDEPRRRNCENHQRPAHEKTVPPPRVAAALNPQPPTLSRSVEHGVFNGSNCWLELAARTNGDGAFTSLSPRQPILPAPYALYAANAGSAAAGAFAGILSPTNFAAQWAGIAATGTVASATTATAAASLAGVNTASIVTNGAEYLVFTNGWYGAGVWHAETNSGFSLQHALDYAATFNPSNVVFYDTNSGFFYLSAPVGGRFQIASGKYYKPDGSRYWISNQMTATWVLTGDGYTTRIQANSNVIDTALHNQNTHAAPPCIEIGNCSIEFKIFAKAPVIYFVESEQELFFHDNLVTWSGVQESGYSDYLITQDWSLLTNQPPGEIGLVCAGSLGKQRVYGNKFCALACDVILPCEHADIERNDFFCTSTYSSNGVQRFGNLWAANDLSAAAVTENGNVFGAEVSVGAALILAGAGDTLVGATHCVDCHNPHRITSYKELGAKARMAVCSRCHKDYVRRHAWLPNTSLHFDYLECATCHSPQSKKSLVFYFVRKSPAGKAKLSYNELVALTGQDPTRAFGERQGSPDTQIARLFTLLAQRDKNVTIDASIIVTKAYDDYSETHLRERQCVTCHSREAHFYDSMLLLLPGRDSSTYIPVKGTLLAKYPIGTSVDFFLVGKEKMKKRRCI